MKKIFVFVSAFIMMRIQMIQFRIKLNLDPDPGDTITQEFDSETDKNADRCAWKRKLDSYNTNLMIHSPNKMMKMKTITVRV